MEKKEIIAFFDRCAPGWDEDMVRNEEVIAAIFRNARIYSGCDVLDVACGTGVLFPDYEKCCVGSLTGIDISPEMTRIAQSKFPDVEVICGDVETTDFSRQFDVVMVYNAFPHFPEPKTLIGKLASLIKPGGRLSIAHGMSRERINAHHSGKASPVSTPLLPERELAALMELYFAVDVVVSNDRMYQVAGTKK